MTKKLLKLLGLSFCLIAPCFGSMHTTPTTPPQNRSMITQSQLPSPLHQIMPITNLCKEILTAIDENDNPEAILDLVGWRLRSFFAQSTYWDRMGTALKHEDNENRKTAFYKSLGFIFAQVLAQHEQCYYDQANGRSFIALRNIYRQQYIVLFGTKKCGQQSTTQPYFAFNDGNVDDSFVIHIDFNVDFCSKHNVSPLDTRAYTNRKRLPYDKSNNLYDNTYDRYTGLTLLSAAYARERNFVAQMIVRHDFDINTISAIFNSIPTAWRHGATETYYTCLLSFLFRSLGNGIAYHQMSTSMGRIDNCIFTGNNEGFLGYIIETKLNHSARMALEQTINQNYACIFDPIIEANGHNGSVLIIGLNIQPNDDGSLIFSGDGFIYSKQSIQQKSPAQKKTASSELTPGRFKQNKNTNQNNVRQKLESEFNKMDENEKENENKQNQ